MHRDVQTHPYILRYESVQMKNVLQENENLARRRRERGSSIRLTNALKKLAMRVNIENILLLNIF